MNKILVREIIEGRFPIDGNCRKSSDTSHRNIHSVILTAVCAQVKVYRQACPNGRAETHAHNLRARRMLAAVIVDVVGPACRLQNLRDVLSLLIIHILVVSVHEHPVERREFQRVHRRSVHDVDCVGRGLQANLHVGGPQTRHDDNRSAHR